MRGVIDGIKNHLMRFDKMGRNGCLINRRGHSHRGAIDKNIGPMEDVAQASSWINDAGDGETKDGSYMVQKTHHSFLGSSNDGHRDGASMETRTVRHGSRDSTGPEDRPTFVLKIDAL